MIKYQQAFYPEPMNSKIENGSGDPVFTVDPGSGIVREANKEARNRCGDANPMGKSLDELIYSVETLENETIPVYFDEQWFLMSRESTDPFPGKAVRYRLEQRQDAPDNETVKSLKKMIGLLVHRFRSPLTGMQGYLELMEDAVSGDLRYSGQINRGLQHLFDLLDELESLEDISLRTASQNNFSADPQEVINGILSTYPDELKRNIEVDVSLPKGPLPCSRGDLKSILSLLIENAVDFAPASEHPVRISRPAPNVITISQNGETVPEAIAGELFYPFVTSRAQQVGIGLTMALLFARRYNGTIFLTRNSTSDGVSFQLCLPPFPTLRSASLN